MRNFRNYRIWEDALFLARSVYELSENLPDREKYNLRNQLFRSACSVPSNIAEGSSRSTDKEFSRYLEISLGSLFEMETQLHICLLCKMIRQEEFDQIAKNITALERRIIALISKIKKA